MHFNVIEKKQGTKLTDLKKAAVNTKNDNCYPMFYYLVLYTIERMHLIRPSAFQSHEIIFIRLNYITEYIN